jgi:5'-3' exonuclease
MQKNFMLIDVNNLGFAAQSKQPLTVGDQQVHAVFHVLRGVRALTARFPLHTPVILWDGVSWRYNAFGDYKANRDKPAKSKHEIKQKSDRIAYRSQRPLLERGFEALGVRQIIAANLEADDLAALLCRKYADRKIMLITGDKDWVQLIGPKVTWLDPKVPLMITPRKIKEILGVVDARAWLDVKCIQGDISDNVTGVGGIGEKGAIELINTYGAVSDFYNQVIVEKTIDFDSLPKKFRDLINIEEKMDLYQRNRMLMDLNHRMVPKPKDLIVTKGRFDPDCFRAFCGELLFKSMLTDLENWMKPFNPNRTVSEME